ncbi:carbon-nitrogen hydrolase family protein [Ferrovibrio sp.]|uniref:carbon-nitrogen hydrolase family protein n=1 Tax=Ferrovibrio sp. TaxID=1917215 RepID=UPI0035B15F65
MSKNRNVTVSMIQICADDDDRAANVAKMLEYLKIAGDRGSQIVALPEVWTGTGFSRDGRLKEIADTIPGDVTGALSEKAREYGMYIVGSIYEKGEDGKYYNTAPVIGPTGDVVAKYRKTHLYDGEGRVDLPSILNESRKVSAGDQFTLVDSNICRFGVAICSDIRFPEIFRQYALSGAEMVILPTAFLSPRVDHWEFLIKARACDNQIFLVATGMAGKEKHSGIAYVGRSAVVDPWGVVQACCNDREVCTTTVVDLDYVREVRSWWPLNQQRRPEMYKALV